MIFKFGEFFCGPGGLGISAHRCNVKKGKELFAIKSAWANDYDRDTCQTYQNNVLTGKNSDGKVICKDVRKLNITELADIDAFAFGFPCNDFSVVGEQKGINGVFGPLYSYGVNVLKHFQPKWFLAENVGGLRNSNDGNSFKKILKEMFNAGYDIFPNLYKFEQYSVPQARHRIIIIGIRHDLNLKFKIPAPTSPIPKTCREAIENPRITADAPNNELTNQAKQVIERLKYIKPGENAFTAELPPELRLKVNGARISQIYKRLDPTKPAYTVTGSGGGGTHVYHWKENRALTNRERARLQTFPDNFIFCGSKESVRKQIGMAVPPVGADPIFEAVLKTFAGISYKSIESNMAEFQLIQDYRTNFEEASVEQLRLLERRGAYA
ncbi:MAG: DNA cytosine methyltransferase [Fibrobacter sp.]|nr:DNA cytosine methyltransferase [Fibrobacter sp.]